MPIFRSKQLIVHFAHIPKCGGSTVEDVLRNYGKLAFLNRRFRPDENKDFPCSPQHYHASFLERLIPQSFFDFSFAVVRNPEERMVSEFKYRKGIRRKLKNGTRPRHLGAEPTEINDWITDAIRNYPAHPFLYDNHLRPQSEFLIKDTEVFRLEDGLGKVFVRLSEVLGQEVMAPEKRTLVSPKIEVNLTEESRALIADFYRSDFEKFGYV